MPPQDGGGRLDADAEEDRAASKRMFVGMISVE